jgi:hypothetical protein
MLVSRLKGFRFDSEHEIRIKHAAQKAVYRAISEGRLRPATHFVCVKCRVQQAQHYHHYLGYGGENWLDIVPLCIACHSKVHSYATFMNEWELDHDFQEATEFDNNRRYEALSFLSPPGALLEFQRGKPNP